MDLTFLKFCINLGVLENWFKTVVNILKNTITLMIEVAKLLGCLKKILFLTNEIKTKIEEQYHIVVSTPIICRNLQEASLRGYIAKKKPLFSKRNRLKQLRFAKMFLNKNVSFWNNVLWTDESKFNLSQ